MKSLGLPDSANRFLVSRTALELRPSGLSEDALFPAGELGGVILGFDSVGKTLRPYMELAACAKM
jgi:hypothetical protein